MNNFDYRPTGKTLMVRGKWARQIDLDERAIAALEEQCELFQEKFGHPPRPDDPIFFDPDYDTPTFLTEAKMEAMFDRWQQAADKAGIGVDVRAVLNRFGEVRRAQMEEHGHSRKIGRNDPCPCGSGLKFKRCHGSN